MKYLPIALFWALFLTLFWKGCGSGLSMETLSKWSGNPIIFWVLWGIEAAVMLWWLGTEMGYKHLRMNPMVFVGWGILALALVAFLADFRIVALILVGIPALPLALMGVFLLVIGIVSIFGGPIRWN